MSFQEGHGSGRGWSSPGRGTDNWRSRGGANALRGGGRNENNVCQNFLKTGECLSGKNCPYSHEIQKESQGEQQTPRAPRERAPLTEKQLQSQAIYKLFINLLKRKPQENDTAGIRKLWSQALNILNGNDRDSKQFVPRDLNEEKYHGKEHIRNLMGMEIVGRGHATFVDIASPFLSVISHREILDCMSVDSAVGGLYSFISGTNGSRAIPFFQRLITSLFETLDDLEEGEVSELGESISALVRSLNELLEREHKVALHEDLPTVIDSIEELIEIMDLRTHMITAHGVDTDQLVRRLRGIVGRRTGIIEMQKGGVGGVVTSAVTSTFPRTITFPSNRHDNDKLDITQIKILPTEEEIRSDHPEFLPSTIPGEPHHILDPAARHLDIHFRLLRHDIFSDLKQALGGLMYHIEKDSSVLNRTNHNFANNVHAYSYSNAWISGISFTNKRGLEASISFAQPHFLVNKTQQDRSRWWSESRRFQGGLLMCLMTLDTNDKISLVFLTVVKKMGDNHVSEYNLSANSLQATVKAKFASTNQHDDLQTLLRLSCQRNQGILIEFPGVMLASFVPILENLQRMQSQSQLPFADWIATDAEAPTQREVPPPLYSRAPGFRFSLAAIQKASSDGESEVSGDELYIDAQSRPDDPALVSQLLAETDLDKGQCEALIAALVREYALIQGPPGTGKTYLGVAIMRVLLAAKEKFGSGPIVVICYTNHALDQFLDHLVNVGINKVIRIGAQSKSDLLKGKNLRVVSEREQTTKAENYEKWQLYRKLEDVQEQFMENLTKLQSTQNRLQLATYKHHLLEEYPEIYDQFSDEINRDGFQLVGDPLELWYRSVSKFELVAVGLIAPSTKTIPEIIEKAEQGIHSLTQNEKKQLVDHWINEIREDTMEELLELSDIAEGVQGQLRNVHEERDRRALAKADVIGVTTTGLALHIAALRRCDSKVVICEEAGEVLEAHMLSALLPSVEHLIQIGDHMQLRPKIENFRELSLESNQGELYKLDRSQFERLSTGDNGRTSFPVAQLNVQRRMRPEISTFIRNTIYQRLVDHESTKHFPSVVGMRQNVCFLNHTNFEAEPDPDMPTTKSHSNDWEIAMTHALVRHIIRQGTYTAEDIAILTPYAGQLQKLRRKFRNDFQVVLSEADEEELALGGFEAEDATEIDGESRRTLEKKKMSDFLRLATVDNFQGEEAKIVIVSLVRSNSRQQVGFLKTSNRINVLLSRAKHGMYIIGNATTYAGVDMWSQVLEMLSKTESIKNTLSLCCSRHPETEILVSEPEHFNVFSPEGGCQRICGREAPCGHHLCQAKCHSETMHSVFPCKQQCQRVHSGCKHVCKKLCDDICGLCVQPINNIKLPCGHIKNGLPCFQTTQNLAEVRCTALDKKEVPGCKHEPKHVINVPCSRDVSAETFKCPEPCDEILQCSHRCPGSCGDCNGIEDNNKKHQECKKLCKKFFVDEMFKRFLVDRKMKLQNLKNEIDEFIQSLENSPEIFQFLPTTAELTSPSARTQAIVLNKKLNDRYSKSIELQGKISKFKQECKDKRQSNQKLSNAASYAAGELSLKQMMNNLKDKNNKSELHNRISFDCTLAQLKTDFHVLDEKLNIARNLKGASSKDLILIFEGPPDQLSKLFLHTCQNLINECILKKLFKMEVEATIYYAFIARAYYSYSLNNPEAMEKFMLAKEMLQKAKSLCTEKFDNVVALSKAVEETLRLLEKGPCEHVGAGEVAVIKQSIINSQAEFMTNSSHWYYCSNGHPFAIGECGMPTEEARCPECGMSAGVQDHQKT